MTDAIVRLNVGGRIFETTESTLRFDGVDNFFTALTSDRTPSLKDSTGAYFIDRNPDCFKVILEFLRCGLLDTGAVSLASLHHEALFYSLDGLVDAVQNKINKSEATATADEPKKRRSSSTAATNKRGRGSSSGARVSSRATTLNTEATIVVKMRKGTNIHRFKIKRDCSLQTLLVHLAPHYNAPSSDIILKLNNDTIDPSQNPNQLGISDTDIIDVLIEAAPRHLGLGANEANGVSSSRATTRIVVKMRKGNDIHKFRIKRDCSLQPLLAQLAPLYNAQSSDIILQLNNETIDPSKNPNQLGISDTDIIDVLIGAAPRHPGMGANEANGVSSSRSRGHRGSTLTANRRSTLIANIGSTLTANKGSTLTTATARGSAANRGSTSSSRGTAKDETRGRTSSSRGTAKDETRGRTVTKSQAARSRGGSSGSITPTSSRVAQNTTNTAAEEVNSREEGCQDLGDPVVVVGGVIEAHIGILQNLKVETFVINRTNFEFVYSGDDDRLRVKGSVKLCIPWKEIDGIDTYFCEPLFFMVFHVDKDWSTMMNSQLKNLFVRRPVANVLINSRLPDNSTFLYGKVIGLRYNKKPPDFHLAKMNLCLDKYRTEKMKRIMKTVSLEDIKLLIPPRWITDSDSE